MKKHLLFPILILFLLLCRFLYPHTRFGYQEELDLLSHRNLNIHAATMKPGEKISVKPSGIKKMASYSTSDFRIATVSPFGTVHALNPGTAIIFVKQGEYTYRCKITVKD